MAEAKEKKAVTWIHLFITVTTAVIGAVALCAKIQFDVNSNREAIQEIKRKAEKNNETINTIAKDTAVLNEKVSRIGDETAKVFEKVDKIYEMILNGKK